MLEFYILATAKVTSGRVPTCESVCMMGGSCRCRGTEYRSPAMVPPLASSGPARCEAVLHSYGTSPLEGVGVVPTFDTHDDYSTAPLEHQAASTMTNQSLLYHNDAEHQAKKRQVSIINSLILLDQDSKKQAPNSNL